MAKVTLSGYIEVPTNDLEAVEREIDNHIQLTRAEAGCLVFEIVQSEGDRCRFDVYEEFSDRAAFEAHQARVKASTWGRVTAGVARHYEVTHGAEAKTAVPRIP